MDGQHDDDLRHCTAVSRTDEEFSHALFDRYAQRVENQPPFTWRPAGPVCTKERSHLTAAATTAASDGPVPTAEDDHNDISCGTDSDCVLLEKRFLTAALAILNEFPTKADICVGNEKLFHIGVCGIRADDA